MSALVVFSSHCAQHWNDRASALLEPFAHNAVVVFFVLSGYVITFATLGRQQTDGYRYAVARISRLYSVVVPALLLTAILQLIGFNIAPDVYARASRGLDVARYVLSTVFMQSAWFLSAAPVTNGPLWSLSYEAWYYAAFGAAVFAPTYLMKATLVGISCLVAGPNILLLAPVWLVGVALYLYRENIESLPISSSGLIALGMAIIVIADEKLVEIPFPLGRAPFFFSASFVTDWIFAIGVAFLIAGCNALNINVSEVISNRMRAIGDFTFPIYLFHFPIIFFWTAVSGKKPGTLAEAIPSAMGILFVVFCLSSFTERYRTWWRISAERIFASMGVARQRR